MKRAVILTGMRDNAIASLQLKRIDVERELVVQDPREVRTKFSKKIVTYFPVGTDLKNVGIDWVRELRKKMLSRARSSPRAKACPPWLMDWSQAAGPMPNRYGRCSEEALRKLFQSALFPRHLGDRKETLLDARRVRDLE
jgi:hypothetical protein